MLPEEAVKNQQNESFTVEIKHKKCSHKDVVLVDSETAQCPRCGAGWMGPNIERLVELLRASL